MFYHSYLPLPHSLRHPLKMSSISQLVTFQADHKGPYNESNNVVRITVPNDGSIYDLSQSMFRCRLIDPEPSITTGEFNSIPNVIDRVVEFGDGTNDLCIENLALIRHAEIQTEKVKPVIDSRRYNNRIMSTLMQYERARTEKVGKGHRSLYAEKNFSGFQGGLFTELIGYGNTVSESRPAWVDIPLTDISTLCNATRWSMMKSGDMTFQLELEPPSNFVMKKVNRIPNNFPVGAEVFNVDDGVIIPEQQFIDPEGIPFYVGQPIKVSYTDSSATPVPGEFDAAITEIRYVGSPSGSAYNTGAFRVELVLSNGFPALPGGGTAPYKSVVINSVSAPNSTFRFDAIEIQLLKVGRGASPSHDMIHYLTYAVRDTSEFTLSTFTLEMLFDSATTANAFLMFFEDGQLTSTSDLKSYLISIKNVYQGRTVKYDSSRHKAMMKRAFMNASMPLRDITEVVPLNSQQNPQTAYTNGSKLVVVPAPLTINAPGSPDTVVNWELEFVSGSVGRRIIVVATQFATLQLGETGLEAGEVF